MNGIAKWLKDKEDNILIPHTLTSAVFNSEGKNVDELLANSSSSIVIDSELSKESENPVQNKVITEKLEEVFQSVSNGKQLVASAITDKGVLTSGDVTFEEMAVNIRSIDTNKKGADFYITPSKPLVDIQKDFFYVEKGE